MKSTVNCLIKAMEKTKTVCIIIPCRNEARFIHKCLDSIIENSFSQEALEVLVLDGMSEDGTRDLVRQYERKYPFIRLIDNHEKTTPVAMNLGIANSRAKYITILSSHSKIAGDFIESCVRTMEDSDADCVGGPIMTVPGDNGLLARSIGKVLSHRFGVGNSHFRTGLSGPRFVDTVPFGFYKAEAFEKAGLFNEDLTRNQDIEFNLRLKSRGGKLLLHPGIKSYYNARHTLSGLAGNGFLNGYWVIYGLRYARQAFSIRHLVPFFFVFALALSGALSALHALFGLAFLAAAGTYMLADLFVSARISMAGGKRLFPFLLISFPVLHFSYGLGSVWGLMKLAAWKAIKT